jgi:hypothetical protein
VTRALVLAFVLGASAPAVEEVGPKAVADPATVKACLAQGNAAGAKKCLKEALGKGQPEAARFAARLNGDGYLRELTEVGKVDVAYVDYVYRGNATTGILLVNGTPAIVDVNAPEHYKKIDITGEPAYAALAKEGGAVELWADDPGRPTAESTRAGGTRFTFPLAVKSCRACPRAGTAVVAFDFDAKGAFAGVRLLELRAGGDKAGS